MAELVPLEAQLACAERGRINDKRKALEAAGWKFERRNGKRRWVRVKSNSRQFARCIEWAWQEAGGNAE